jgi:PHD/YefM family antitoxin component YafN of YafNO toxin-antitoxin module
MELVLTLSISEARARLPELAQLVMETPGRAIIIEHRDRKERVVLTAESHFLRLEAMVEHLKDQSAAPFSLAGSITSDLADEDLETALQGLREEAAAGAAAKLVRSLEK